MNSLDAIRERARESVLGKSIARALDHAILDRQVLLDLVDDLAQAETLLFADNVRLGDRLAAVRELHQERPNSTSALYPNPLCSCGKEYPCPTIKALEGDQ